MKIRGKVMARDYYQILGVPRNANGEQIKKAYRRLAMRYHPDRNLGNEKWANEKFKEINEAFSILGDPEKKRQYDQFGTMGDIGNIFSSRVTRSTFEDLMEDFGGAGLGFDFLDDIFEDFVTGRGFSFKNFCRGFDGPGGMRFTTWKGTHLEDILKRAKPASKYNANYAITLTREQATHGLESDLIRKGKKLRVEIPAGVKSGSKVKLKNAPQITDNRARDIVIQIKVKE